MKKKQVIILILSLLLIIPLFSIKVNADVVERTAININYNAFTSQQLIVFTPPKNYYQTSNLTYALLSNTWIDPDGPGANNVLQIQTTDDTNKYKIGYNNTFLSNKYLYSDELYALHLYPNSNTTKITLYKMNTIYDSQAGEINFSLGDEILSVFANYNLSGGDQASNIIYYFIGGLITSYNNTWNAQTGAWTTEDIDFLINNVFNYDLFNYEIIDGYDNGYQDGYNNGYDTGYDDGSSTVTAFDYAWNFLSGVFSALGSILSLELIPHVPIGLFLLIPLFFGGVGLILWIWRRN